MDSTVSFRTPVGDISAAPGAVPQADAPLGRDAGRDSALHYAAISIFGLCGVAVLAVAVGCYAVAGSDPDWPLASGLTGVGAALHGDAEASAQTMTGAPALRPGFAGEAGRSFTIFDSATGQREVLIAAPDLDTADALDGPPPRTVTR